jgi:hypothetical protein|tara:strand:+ start:753 stop:1481 length:729 start_codon:yes stop_codon:yes gene_type:complete
MRSYIINKKKHNVFEDVDEVPGTIDYLYDWKHGTLGDWVLADDGCVLQIIRAGVMFRSKGSLKKVEYVGTCTGTFLKDNKMKMDSDKRENIYSLSGKKSSKEVLNERKNLTGREELFIHNLQKNMVLKDAYINAFKTDNEKYAETRAMLLIKTERVQKKMKEHLKPILAKLEIDEELVLGGIKQIALDAEKDSDRLKALTELSEVLDIKDKGIKVQEITGMASKELFSGFTDENVSRPKLGE